MVVIEEWRLEAVIRFLHCHPPAADAFASTFTIIDEDLSESFPETLNQIETRPTKCEHQFDNSQRTSSMLRLQRVTTLLHLINNMKQ
jgi:hypothetical protein